MAKRKPGIRNFIIQNIHAHPRDIGSLTARAFGISRQAVNRYLRELTLDKIIETSGQTRNREYRLRTLQHVEQTLEITPSLQEDQIWREIIRPSLGEMNDNVLRICQYGFTEMLNNAISHSEGKTIKVSARTNIKEIRLTVRDDGVGIFSKIKRELHLDDERYALLELTKGKLTTDPSHHSGEGIFFTSRVFDRFMITSGSITFIHSEDDWQFEEEKAIKGTVIGMLVSRDSQLTLKEVFDEYSAETSDYGFTKTIVPVDLARYGDENLISRSQARRLLVRFDRFKEVLLDFNGVESIGQAFADEIFRVFRHEHPNVVITWTNANDDVKKMIRRAETHQDGLTPSK